MNGAEYIIIKIGFGGRGKFKYFGVKTVITEITFRTNIHDRRICEAKGPQYLPPVSERTFTPL